MTTATRTGYVLCRGVMEDPTGEIYESLEDVVPHWKGTLSLRWQEADGTIRQVSQEEYDEATDLAHNHPPVGSRWRKKGWTYQWEVVKRGPKWITLNEFRPGGHEQRVRREDWPGGWERV